MGCFPQDGKSGIIFVLNTLNRLGMKKWILGLTAIGCVSGMSAQTLKVSTEPDKKGKAVTIPAYLPRQELRIEFTVLREEFTKGELAEFTPRYFSSASYIKESGRRYSIKNVTIKPLVVPDQASLYYLQPGEGTVLDLTETGILRSVNRNEAGEIKEEVQDVRKTVQQSKRSGAYPMLSMVTRLDTVITREISVDSTIIERRKINRVWVKNDPESLAKEIIEKINDIREKKYFLVTGPEDVMIDGTGIQASVRELDLLEQQYLEMFFGHTHVVSETRSFTVYPTSKKEEEFSLGSFSTMEAWGGNSMPVKVTLKAEAAAPGQNGPGMGLPVAVPARTEVSVSVGNTVYASEIMPITQKGSVQYLPLGGWKKVQLLFNENTGALLNIGN